jgi:hypothetical protein
MLGALKRRRARKKFEADTITYRGDLADWEDADEAIDRMLEVVRDCVAGRVHEQFTDRSDHGFMLENDEFPVASISGSALLQVVRAPGQYRGGYGGVSFPIFGRVRGHVGGNRGTFVPGKESMTMTDEGTTMITNKRVMFRGSVRTDEWKFSRMMAMEHADIGMTTIFMSSGGKPEAIGYGNDVGAEVQFRFEIAAALARGTLERFLHELEAEKAHHQQVKPVPPPAAPAG